MVPLAVPSVTHTKPAVTTILAENITATATATAVANSTASGKSGPTRQ
jgi:hypothetical protein